MVDAVHGYPLPTVASLIDRWASERANSTALKFDGRITTFLELAEKTNRVSNKLRELGLRDGDRIAYLGKNSDTYFVLLYGAARIGIVMAPIGWRLSPREVAHVLEDTEARLLFIESEHARTARDAAGIAGRAIETVETDGIGAWLAGVPATPPSEPADIDSPMLQIYTSGTTGRPKGAVITQRNLVAPHIAWPAGGIEWDAWAADDVGLVAMPIAHIAGTNWGFLGLLHGAAIIITRQFDPSEVLDLIDKEGANRMFIVAAALQAMVRDPRVSTIDFSRIRNLFYGASPIPLPLLRESMAALGVGFCQQYGLTEASGTIVALGPEDHDPAGTPRMRSAGKALPGTELKIIDATGASCAVHEIGEILVRSQSVMQGYWKMPEATAAAIDDEGWLHTGDAGYLDEDGYLFICDRLKDMIITGGENVYPAEIESIFAGHPAIAEVAVIGVPDERWGEAVKLVAVPRSGQTIDPPEILEWGRQQLAGFKLPKSVDVVDALPRNPSGKILKRELRAPYWADRDREVN